MSIISWSTGRKKIIPQKKMLDVGTMAFSCWPGDKGNTEIY